MGALYTVAYLITLLVCRRMVGGIVRPRALAVFKFMTRSTYPIDLPRLLRVSGQRPSDQSEDKSTNKPDGPELHNGLLSCYEHTNITGKRVVQEAKTQLNDALISLQGTVPLL